jgi:choline-glycine betaine transporter
MQPLAQFMDALGTLDLVLAVFGAIVVSMWFGRGRKLRGLISGAVVGGLLKSVLLIALVGGAFVVSQESRAKKQTPEQQRKTLDFWAPKRT